MQKNGNEYIIVFYLKAVVRNDTKIRNIGQHAMYN